jgi:hypothetical protein
MLPLRWLKQEFAIYVADMLIKMTLSVYEFTRAVLKIGMKYGQSRRPFHG